MPQSLDDAIRLLRITTTGMAMGVLVFAAIAYFLRPTMRDFEGLPPAPVFLGVLAVISIGSAAAYLMQYRRVIGALRVQAAGLRLAPDPVETVIGVYRPFAITGAAMIEGPSFFAVVVYLLTGRSLALAAVGLGVVLLLWHMPSRERLQHLAERAAGT